MELNDTPADQAPEQSVEDRLANFLAPQDEQANQPEAASEEAEEAAPVEETFEFERDGKKHTLPKELESEFLMQKDYTQKTQALAEKAKDVERQAAQFQLAQQESQFSESIKPKIKKLDMIDAVLEQYAGMDWRAMSPDQFMNAQREEKTYEKLRVSTQKEIDEDRANFGAHIKTQLEKIRTDADEAVKRRIPGWSEKSLGEILEYGLSKGLSQKEIENAWDPRYREILWEGVQFRRLQATAQPVTQQAKSVKANSSNPMPQQVKEKLAFNKAVKSANSTYEKSKLAEARLSKIFGG